MWYFIKEIVKNDFFCYNEVLFVNMFVFFMIFSVINFEVVLEVLVNVELIIVKFYYGWLVIICVGKFVY